MQKQVPQLTNSAFHSSDASSNATVVENIVVENNVLANIGVARWNVDKNQIVYQKQDSHTLSIYLSGGESSFRADARSLKGAPGKICLMPQGHESVWHINGEIEFLHLYFTDDMLKQYATANFDSDVRFIELRDLIYQEDPALQNLFEQFFTLCDGALISSPLLAEQTMHQVMHHLIKRYNGFKVVDQEIKGGLSPVHMRLIRAAIFDRLREKLSIESLAMLVNLSPFHFARMFKISFGESPANYITRIRIDAVKAMLSSNVPLVEISMMAGFSHQSHMTRIFKASTGLTPANYRRAL